jgi:hypothetical protein
MSHNANGHPDPKPQCQSHSQVHSATDALFALAAMGNVQASQACKTRYSQFTYSPSLACFFGV